MTRHSHQDALDDSTYEQLVDATAELRHPFDAEALTILVLAGRLGMRAGEISHMTEDWIDWERKIIEIPTWEPCDCGYCRQQAQQAADHNEELSFEEALANRWEPKTSTSARAIPFDFDDEIEAIIQEFFTRWDEYPHSRASINRRVDRVAEAADFPTSKIYPHALRATAATFHAYRGLPSTALQSLMGWAKLATAEKYIRLSGGATAKALRECHSGRGT